ncbi:hypothetical protein TNIN_356041 [Trichonephila inaurata madagascariensis]|uniref:Uncharacterized protein n=1 Tax=Trichonephila inaurata madagascariensis TaxID=2747483 RepID=A0A8X6XVF4_9ARAC|nr:hypothetical protein TNIN_356041 [Trichonephila inaurata madagascariensis]
MRNPNLCTRSLLASSHLYEANTVVSAFWDNPIQKFPLGKELDTPSIAEKMSSNICQLKDGEDESLTSALSWEILNLLLESFQNIFEPGGEATTMLDCDIAIL